MDDPEDGDDFDNIQDDFDDTDDQDSQVNDQQDDQDDDQGQQADDQDADDDQQPARKPSRAQARIEALDREVREARERESALQRQLEEIRSGQSRTSEEQRRREEQERFNRMDPLERAEYRARSVEERTSQQIGALSQQIADSTDRAAFAEACVDNPALAKVKDRVEDELRKLRAAGQTVPRETLAKYLIGDEILKKAPKARARAERRGAANLDRERGRPAGGASDAPARGRETNDKAARDKRLENFTF